MARIEGIGNLGSNPELKYLGENKDKPVCEFRFYLKSDRRKGEGEWEDRGDFLAVSVWGACAEPAAKMFRKGDGVFLQGKFGTDRWKDKESGEERKGPKIDANLALPYLPYLESISYKPRKVTAASSSDGAGASSSQINGNDDDAPY